MPFRDIVIVHSSEREAINRDAISNGLPNRQASQTSTTLERLALRNAQRSLL